MTTNVLSGGPDQVVNYERRWWILAVLGVAQLMVILDNTIINIALPTAQRALHFSNADRQWVVTAYSLAFGSLLLLGGRIGDIFGRKRTLLVGLIGFACASAVGGASTGFAMLVVARGVQGCFAALLAPSVLALMNTTFTDLTERGRAFGIYGAIAGAGGAIGLLLGGLLTTYISWRWTLYVNLLFAAIAVGGATLWLKNDKGAYRDPIDIPGLLLVTGGLFSLVFGLSHAETTSWSDTYTVGFLILGLVLLAAFALLESRVTFPLLPPRIVRNRTRGGSMLAMVFASAGLLPIFLFLTYYLQEILGFSPIKSGVTFLPMVAGLVVMSQVSNRALLPRFGPKLVMPMGLLLAAVAMYLLHGVGLENSYLQRVLPSLLILGIGLGVGLAPAFSTATLGLQSGDAGVGSAALNTSQQVGGSIGVALLNTLAASAATAYLVSHAPSPSRIEASALHGYTTAFLWSSFLFAAAAVIAVVVFQRGNLRSLTRTTTADGSSDREINASAHLRTTCWQCAVSESDNRVGTTAGSS